MTMPFHELSSLFPLMSAADLAELEADIKDFGQRELIVVLDDQILDGRNRAIVCERLGIQPRMREFTCVDGDPLQYVWSQNITRRHMTVAQRAIALAKKIKFTEQGNTGYNHHAKLRTGVIPMTIPEAAKLAKVSPRTMSRAKKIVQYGTDKQLEDAITGKAPIQVVADTILHPNYNPDIRGPGRPSLASDDFYHNTGSRIGIPKGYTPEEYARYGIELEEKDGLPTEVVASKLGVSGEAYRKMRAIVQIYDRKDLTTPDRTLANQALKVMNETYQVRKIYETVVPIANRIWGTNRNKRRNAATNRTASFEKQMDIIGHVCAVTIEVPQLNMSQVKFALETLEESVSNLNKLISDIKEIYR